jgi:hypothetical protein
MEDPRSPRIIPNWLFIRSTKSSVSRNQSFVLVLVLVVVLESAGKLAQNRPVNSKFFDNARGSAIECVACLDASAAKGFASSERTQSGKEMLVRIVAMLTKLVECFDPYQYRVRENAPSLVGRFEHEDDDEHEDD